MIDSTRRWLRKNRTNFAVGFGILGAGYVAGQYVISKITETRNRMTSDRITQENLRRRFQQNQEDCTITVLELLPTLTENVLDALPAEQILQELQQKKAERLGRSAATSETAPSELSSGTPSAIDEDGKSLSSESFVHASQVAASTSGSEGEVRPTRTKVQLWNHLKIHAVTRALTLLYTVSLLSLLTRVQLNLLGRRNYLCSVVAQASHVPQVSKIKLENHEDDGLDRLYGNDFETNRKYLTFSWWLLHRGWRDIMTKVEIAVKEVIGPLKPTENIRLDDFSALVLRIRKKVEGSTVEERSSRTWLPYLIPPQSEEDSVLRESGVHTTPTILPTTQDPSTIASTSALPNNSNNSSSPALRRLLDETSDLIESPIFTHVYTLLLDVSFSELADQKIRTEAYGLQPLRSEPTVRIQDLTEKDPYTISAKLANILAVMTKEAHKIGSSNMPNDYLQVIEKVGDLEAFAAVIYTSTFELEASTNSPMSASADQLDKASFSQTRESPSQEAPGVVNKAISIVDAAGIPVSKLIGEIS